ncbi:DUF4870 domain-containing protein [Halalkalibacter sp. AB-rgal2]|uniref:DUF4870 domain-containing protein n=1 Tax=Halalkalibacter sp. AB-rgal2 TaxID=3242695 RepID=UPI00359E6C59
MEEEKQMNDKEEKTSTGMTQNVSGALCYLAGFVTGIIFLFIEKENKFIRYHAFQSIFLWAILFIFGFVVGMIPILGVILPIFFTPLCLFLWLYCMYKAYQGSDFQLPFVGQMANDQIEKSV